MLEQLPIDQNKRKVKKKYVFCLTATTSNPSVRRRFKSQGVVSFNKQYEYVLIGKLRIDLLPSTGAVGVQNRGRSALELSPATSGYLKCSNSLLSAGQI